MTSTPIPYTVMNTNFIKIAFLSLVLFWSTQSFGQSKDDYDRIKSIKIAFFTEQLQIDTEQAKEFWPIYNVYETEQIEMYKRMKAKMQDGTFNIDTMSEQDALTEVNHYIDDKTAEHERTIKLYRRLLKVLPAKVVYKLPQVEDEFRRKLMRMYRKHIAEGRGNTDEKDN